jgi:hypothetical protein
MRNWDYRFIRLAFSGVRRTDSNVATLSTQGNGKFIAPIAPQKILSLDEALQSESNDLKNAAGRTKTDN